MIKVPTKFSPEFIEEYYNIVSDMVFLNKINEYNDETAEYREFKYYLSQNFLKIITASFNELLDVLTEVNNLHPIISECYNPQKFFKGTDLNEISSIVEIMSIHLRGDANLNRICALKSDAINEISIVNRRLQSHYVDFYISELNNSNDAHSIKSCCKKIYATLNDGNIDIEVAPEWVRQLKNIMSYESMPGEILRKVGDELALDYCPMCNESQVGNITDENRVYRQALDHFLPKSKYPIFSLSIYNLIPCCNTCNSLFKRDKDTLSPPHANPYVQGSDEHVIFDIEALALAMLYKKESGSRVRFIATNTNVDNNIKLFKLLGVYNKRETKRQILRIMSLFNSYYAKWNATMTYEEFLVDIVDYDSSKLPYEIIYGKFKMDLLDFMEKVNH
ncbi:hypothetical protein UXO11_23170 [Enterobacter wuhouensis]|uniref:hypothetical protein n=1 Tax=Enterobacter wuhouensis TaxID=2529381 RepID=UPI002FD47BE1